MRTRPKEKEEREERETERGQRKMKYSSPQTPAAQIRALRSKGDPEASVLGVPLRGQGNPPLQRLPETSEHSEETALAAAARALNRQTPSTGVESIRRILAGERRLLLAVGLGLLRFPRTILSGGRATPRLDSEGQVAD